MSKRFFSVDRIKQYDGVGGSGLAGKFLSGTTEGFVLTDISNINTNSTDYYVTGGTYNALTNTLTLNRQNGSVIVTGFTSGGGGGVNYERRSDYIYPYHYSGTAPVGTLDSGTWTIKRIDFTTPESPITLQSTGSWDNRISLIYS